MKNLLLTLLLIASITAVKAQTVTSTYLSTSNAFHIQAAQPLHYYGIMVNAPDPKDDWTKRVNYQFFVLRPYNSTKEIMKVGLPDTNGTTKIIIDIRKIHFINDTTIIIK